MTMQHAKEHPQMKPGTKNAQHRATGTPDKPHLLQQMVKQNDNPPNKPTQLPPGNDDVTRQNNRCQTKHTNDDQPDQTQESTTHPLWQMNPTPAEVGVVIFKVSILLNPHPPTEAMTPLSENMQPWVRGNPNGAPRSATKSALVRPKNMALFGPKQALDHWGPKGCFQ
ncbi:hypothetical protein BS47DRAFT_1458641 [Hydnum rufescens UP504]|uniref:Uncharacterized protein n=1 Tax=Hydnum rufescens UP504 TaxID=1448309 RepID=A0A9P6AAY7_9AGAM|nr:hypothetical protein BS47DRAFT_1458641 [Hydnum rufescens UP504]